MTQQKHTASKRTSAPAKKPLSKAEQRRRFEETARELGCDEGQALDAAFSKIVPPKLPNAGRQGEQK
jgi:hypothetical protein